MNVLSTLMHLAPVITEAVHLIGEAETAFSGKARGAEKKQFVLDGVKAIGGPLLQQLPASVHESINRVMGDVIDIAVAVKNESGK